MDFSTKMLRLRKDTPHRRVANEGVMVLQDEGDVMVINDIGYRILELAGNQLPLAGIFETLVTEYDVPRDVLEKDVIEFVEQLTANGVVHLVDSQDHADAK